MPSAHPRIAGIAGPSCSGKSTLAKALAARHGSGALLFPVDAFYHDLGHLEPSQRGAHNFDHPDAIDWGRLHGALNSLCAGQPAMIPAYDFAAHTRAAEGLPLAPRPLILLEGIHVLQNERLRERLSAGIYLDCPRAICLERRIARDTAERGRTEADIRRQFDGQVWPMAEQFVLPSREYAGLVLDGTGPVARNLDAAAAWLAEAGATAAG